MLISTDYLELSLHHFTRGGRLREREWEGEREVTCSLVHLSGGEKQNNNETHTKPIIAAIDLVRQRAQLINVKLKWFYL